MEKVREGTLPPCGPMVPAPTEPELLPDDDDPEVVAAPDEYPEEVAPEEELELAAALAPTEPEVVLEAPAPELAAALAETEDAVAPEDPMPEATPLLDPVAAAVEVVAAAEGLTPVPAPVVEAPAGWMTSPRHTCSAGSQVAPAGQSASELQVDVVNAPELQAERERPSQVRFVKVFRMGVQCSKASKRLRTSHEKQCMCRAVAFDVTERNHAEKPKNADGLDSERHNPTIVCTGAHYRCSAVGRP